MPVSAKTRELEALNLPPSPPFAVLAVRATSPDQSVPSPGLTTPSPVTETVSGSVLMFQRLSLPPLLRSSKTSRRLGNDPLVGNPGSLGVERTSRSAPISVLDIRKASPLSASSPMEITRYLRISVELGGAPSGAASALSPEFIANTESIVVNNNVVRKNFFFTVDSSMNMLAVQNNNRPDMLL